jgi:hypothetical protein
VQNETPLCQYGQPQDHETVGFGETDRRAVQYLKRKSEEQHKKFEREFREMSLLDIYSSNQISRTRREVIRELIQANAEEETIKRIICPELIEAEVQEKKRAWLEMRGRLDEN